MNKTDRTIKSKLGLLELSEHIGVSKACKILGYSRDTYYRYKKLYDQGGELALQEVNRKKPNLKNRTEQSIISLVVEMAFEKPTLGKAKVSKELNKRGIFISPGGVRGIWLRYDLENLQKRTMAIQNRVVQDEIILTQNQLEAMHSFQDKLDTTLLTNLYYPGNNGLQFDFEIGIFQNLGKVYIQCFVDTYCKIAFARLYNDRSASISANFLTEQVIPFYKQNELKIKNILTDKGKNFISTNSEHSYQCLLRDENINHKRISKQNMDNCKHRFMEILQQEFLSVMPRRKKYTSIMDLQKDLDSWLNYYNNERKYLGKYCYGKSPMQTFKDALLHGKP